MTIYLEKPQSFLQLIKQTFMGYPRVFKATWHLYFLFLFIALLASSFLFKINIYLQIALAIITNAVEIFLYGVIFYLCHCALTNKPAKLKEAITRTKKRYLALWGGALILFIIGVTTVFLCIGIIYLGKSSSVEGPYFGAAFLVAMFVFLLCYFFYPLLVLENNGLFKTLQKSIKLFLLNSWHVVGLFLFIIILLAIVAAPFVGIANLTHQTVMPAAAHFIFNFLAYPLTFSSILVLLHDCNVRLKMREKVTARRAR